MKKSALLSALIVLLGVLPGRCVLFTPEQASKITLLSANILENAHYRQKRIDEAMSKTAFDNYLNQLDALHIIFLQSDVDEFRAMYETRLGKLVNEGNPTPGFVMFDRYRERLTQRLDAVEEMLQGEFDFTTDEWFETDRSEAAWPATAEEATDLWRKRIKYDMLNGLLAEEKKEDIITRLQKRYHRLERYYEQLETEDKLEIFLTAVAAAFDPHSAYMSPTEAENFEISQIKLSLTGIGALLGIEDDYTKIINLIPGGPAARSGELNEGDRIIAVAQGAEEPVDVVAESLKRVVSLIRGPIRTEVWLTILPADGSAQKVVMLVRDKIELKEQHAKAKIVDAVDENGVHRLFGFIHLPGFYANCADDVAKLLERMKEENVSGVVLDMRRNSGGLLDEAVKLTGLFIDRGPVVQVKDYRNKTDILRDRDRGTVYDGPLVVMVNRLSASAAEIVAAALQDYERAIVVGDEATHGKGTVQTVYPLAQLISPSDIEDPGDLKFTISKFYRVEGNTTQRNGVTPDIILPSLYDYLDLGEANLKNNLEPDRTTAADYEPVGQVNGAIGKLRRESGERVKTDRDFVYVSEDIDLLKKQLEEKKVSLNLEKRKAEKLEKEERAEARRVEQLARPEPGYLVYTLDLDMVANEEPMKLLTKEELLGQTEEDATDGEIVAADADSEKDDEEKEKYVPLLDAYEAETLRILGDFVDESGRGRLVAGKELL